MLLLLVFVAVNFWLKAHSFLDPDFGWHLRMGQLITQQGIPQTDPFSYTMPSYPFVDHEWLTNVGFAFLYQHIGLNGMSLFFVLLALCAIGLQVIVSPQKWRLLPFLLVGISFMPFLGIRPQVLSWLLFSLLLLVVLNKKVWKKFRWGLPLLMVLWTNLHGSFPLGILIILLSVFIEAIQWQKKKLIFKPKIADIAVVVLVFSVTFLNPYGWRVWWEVGMQLSDPSLHFAIQEWLPALFLFNDTFLFLLPLSVILVWKYWKKFRPVELAIYGILLLMGLSSSRHVPFWLLTALSVTSQGLSYLHDEVKRYKFGTERFRIAYKVLFVVALVMVGIDFLLMLPQANFAQLSRSPNDAVAFLKAHPSQGNLFDEYGYGGYLIWQYPQKKVFIDGRMPSWRRNYSVQGESNNAFYEYEQVMSGSSDIKTIFKKYKIDTVILTTQEDPENLASIFRKITPLHLVNKPRVREQLQKMGMKVLYQDGLSIIYRK